MNNLEKAKTIYYSNFHVYGYGHFDISYEELAYILDCFEKENPETLIQEFYEKLSSERLD